MKKIIPIIFILFLITGCSPVVFGSKQNGDFLKPLIVQNLPAKVIYEDPQKIKTSTNTARLTFFGDLMLDRSVKKQIDKNGADYIFEKLYAESSTTLFVADIIHANLEGPFADKRRPTSKSIAFRFDPTLISMVKKYGFNIFSQANNHSLDMGAAGFTESLKNLRENSIDVYGNQYQINSSSLFIKEINGLKIAFIGLNDTNSTINKSVALDFVNLAKTKSDRLIINIHWGEEYKTISNSRQRELAHWLIDSGADVIVGHHPHVVQEMEIYKNHPIFYSLGNFVFDQYFSTETQRGLAVRIDLEKEKISFSIWPLQSNVSQVSLIGDSAKEKFMSSWLNNSRLSGYNISTSTYSFDI